MDPGGLGNILPSLKSAFIMSSTTSSEDACVLDISKQQRHLVQTCDFIAPPCDEAYFFGRIAAANAVSDIYAMGAWPFCAMNILALSSSMSAKDASELLKGASDLLEEDDIALAGGHSINALEPFFGLSVSGFCEDFYSNNTAKIGDVLILTKRLGTGVLMAANKRGELAREQYIELLSSMSKSNKNAAYLSKNFKIHACTDITGFGLLGHLSEMLNDEISFALDTKSIEHLSGVLDFMRENKLPGGCKRNLNYAKASFKDEKLALLLSDAQTSGGLLFALAKDEAQAFLSSLKESGENAFVVGEVRKREGRRIYL